MAEIYSLRRKTLSALDRVERLANASTSGASTGPADDEVNMIIADNLGRSYRQPQLARRFREPAYRLLARYAACRAIAGKKSPGW
jgi:hypothetical protein